MHVTFNLLEIEEMMLQQARKQLETELETTLHSFGDVCCLYTAVLVSPVQSIVQSTVQSTVQSMVQSRVQLLQRPKMYCPNLQWGIYVIWAYVKSSHVLYVELLT